jgi:hypothetical protein
MTDFNKADAIEAQNIDHKERVLKHIEGIFTDPPKEKVETYAMVNN